MDCREAFPLLDACIDGELGEAEAAAVRTHAAACAGCRTESADRERLRRALSRLELPETSVRRPSRPRLRVMPYAAALLLVALVFLAVPAAVPPVVALTSRLHDRVVEGGVGPAELGLRPAVPPGPAGAGDCCCPPEGSPAAPLLLYRRGDTLVTCLVSADDPGPLPARTLRRAGSREVHVFRAGRNSVALSRENGLCRLWVARLPEDALLRAIAAVPAPNAGRLSLERATCGACCELMETRARTVPGVSDARLDLLSLELVVTPEGGPAVLPRVLEELRLEGFRVRPR